jgi:hypothetical protein
MEVAVRASGITTEGRTIHVEAEAASEPMITIANIARITIFESVGSSHCVRPVDVEVGNELHKQRLGGWQVWNSWGRNDNKSIREVELMVWIEDGFWLHVVWILIADAQRRDVIELEEISYF